MILTGTPQNPFFNSMGPNQTWPLPSLESDQSDNSRMSGRCSDSSHALITVGRTLPNELSVITNFAIASSLGVSEMSSQNIPLKGCTDFRESSRIPATETVRV